MKHLLKKAVQKILSRTGYTVTKTRKHSPLPVPGFARLWQKLNHAQRIVVAPYLPYSKSQIAQDLFVLLESRRRAVAPYFVEFGATDGSFLSNTLLLEQQLGWMGILAEPAHIYHEALHANRKCHIDTRCVTDHTANVVRFVEQKMNSGIAEFRSHRAHNVPNKVYDVPTVSLCDLLKHYDAPSHIGYLSIDTEGSELMILQAFDFEHHHFDVITVEHNYIEKKRQAIFQLLTSKGYVRQKTEWSFIDDWYVRE